MSETIFDAIAQHAQSSPDAVAIQVSGRKPLTYSRLRDQILYGVETLHGIGIGRNDRVAVALPTGAEMATAALAVMTAASAAPINPEYRTAELEFLLSSLGAKLVVTPDGVECVARSVARSMKIPVLELSAEGFPEAGVFRLRPGEPASRGKKGELSRPDDLAIVLHTSGTTARPKTVPLSQRNAWISMRNVARSLQLGPADRCLHVLPMFHIGGLIDVLAAPLAVGGSVVCTPGFSAPEFFKCLDLFRPTWCQAVPTMLQEILTHADEHRALIATQSLRLMRSVSAPLPARVMEQFERVFRVPVIEIFGMTEAAGLITSNPLPPGKRKPGSVGVAAGPEVSIVDENGTFLPTGRTGEVVVRGANLMRAYEGGVAENGRDFFGTWFRTGDLGYMDGDGYLFLTGRAKEIINRGGEKISPREVDEAILEHPAVAAAATFPIPHASLGEELAAAVVVRSGATLTKQDLTAFLGVRLAYFKVPRIVHFLDRLPSGPGGKLRRLELARTLGAVTSDGPEFVAPATPIAKILARRWANLLEVTAIGIHDNFFELGGDSLKAASFVNEVQQQWGDTVYVSALFDAPSVAEFEDYLQKNYPDLVARMLGECVRPHDFGVGSRVDASKLARLRGSIARPAPLPEIPRAKNPPAVFILCPPRSGSTLLRVMLGGNSRLFAPPELYLLPFNSLADRKAWLTGSQRFQLEGNVRCVMQLKNLSPDAAQAHVRQLEERSTPTQEYYRLLQEWLGDRILVDKTPSYAVLVETLERAERYFDNPMYIHLVRHPYGMIRSFEEAKLEQLWYPRLVGTDEANRTPCPYRRRELAEMIWLILHQNIADFLGRVPAGRQYRVKFEDLVQDPRRAMEGLCRFLQVDFERAMLEPQASPGERMTDGLYPVSRMIGDMKFHRHEGIAPETAELWKHYYEIDFLSDETWAMAAAFGYDESLAKAKNRQEFEI